MAILGSISVKLKSFGKMYRGLLSEVEKMQRELFGGIEFKDDEWFGFSPPEHIADDPNCNQPGYFFADHEFNAFRKYEDMGIKTLFNHPRLHNRYGFVRGKGEITMNAVACNDFLRRAEDARSKLASACHISLGGPPRGTEFAANYLRNHPKGDLRNVNFINGSLCFISGYNKTSHRVSCSSEKRRNVSTFKKQQSEKKDVIYRFIPKDLERLYLIEWLIIRPTEIFLAAALGLDGAVEELRFKLFPGVHQPFTSSTLSQGLKRDAKTYVGSAIGISKYRDIQSNFMEYHPNPLSLAKNDTADRQQGHSSKTASQWYNRSQGIPHGSSVANITEFRNNSHWWQHISGT